MNRTLRENAGALGGDTLLYSSAESPLALESLGGY
jgi:hypothetical protein